MKKERTLVIIKPDGVQRSLIGEVIKRYERVGLKLAAIKMIVPSTEQVNTHYTVDPNWVENTGKRIIQNGGESVVNNDPIKEGEKVLSRLCKYITAGPVICMVWQGVHAVEVVRKMTGGTEPKTSDVGTIRGDYVLDSYEIADKDNRSIRNIVHASGTIEEANKEIGHWFEDSEIVEYNLDQDAILYGEELEGIV
jgi:nucleoside-diphosphate kinase